MLTLKSDWHFFLNKFPPPLLFNNEFLRTYLIIIYNNMFERESMYIHIQCTVIYIIVYTHVCTTCTIFAHLVFCSDYHCSHYNIIFDNQPNSECHILLMNTYNNSSVIEISFDITYNLYSHLYSHMRACKC